MKKIINEFKTFAAKGNVIDLAVGIIIGAAFGKIVTSFVNDIFMPPLGALIGGIDFTSLSFSLGKEAVLKYGNFIQAVVDFLVIAFAIFLLVKGMNKLKKKEEEKPKEPSEEVKLLTEIRDVLKKID
jgi:large conductance mechanosensitive channel